MKEIEYMMVCQAGSVTTTLFTGSDLKTAFVGGCLAYTLGVVVRLVLAILS